VEQLAVINFMLFVDKKALEFVVINKNSKNDKLNLREVSTINNKIKSPNVIEENLIYE